MIATMDRYQRFRDLHGTMDTERWFDALLAGVDGPLGSVLDVGAAEGVMCVLAAQRGAESVLGIGLHDDRMAAALELTADYPAIEIWEQRAEEMTGSFRTVVFSMMAHWLGANETARFAKMATRNFCIVFRTANDHYEIPANGTWFPTLKELDATVGGVRTHEELLMVQDHGKETWAATYRTDIEIRDGMVYRPGREPMPLHSGHDLHGDQPFRPTIGIPLTMLTPWEQSHVAALAVALAHEALDTGHYPGDFSPRNVIVNEHAAFLVDRDPSEEMRGMRVAPEYLPVWRATLSTVGIDFDGDLRSLL